MRPILDKDRYRIYGGWVVVTLNGEVDHYGPDFPRALHAYSVANSIRQSTDRHPPILAATADIYPNGFDPENPHRPAPDRMVAVARAAGFEFATVQPNDSWRLCRTITDHTVSKALEVVEVAS